MRQIRRSKITDEIISEILAMRRNGIKMVCIAYDLNISVGTVHKYIKLYKKNAVVLSLRYTTAIKLIVSFTKTFA